MTKTTDRRSHAFDMLRSANPVDLTSLRRQLDEGSLAAARAHALARLEDESAPSLRGLRRPHRRALGLRLLGATAAIAAIVTGVVSVLPGGTEPARAVQVLDAAATTARLQPPTAPGPGDYRYVRERLGLLGGPAETVEWWVAAEGSGRMRRIGASTIGVFTRSDGRRTVVKGRGRSASDVTFGPRQFDAVFKRVNPGVLPGRLDDLPTDPKPLEAALGRELRKAADFNPDPAAQSLEMLQLIEGILANPLASPQLRGAAYEVAADLEGVQTREQVRDPAGRLATAIALCSGAVRARYELFFDPATAATLATREVDSACDERHPQGSAITAYSVYLQQGTVDSISERP